MSRGRIFICSFGFDERFIVRCLVRHRFGMGDVVKLVTVEPLEDRVLEAYKRVEELVRRLGGGVELITIDCTDVYTALSRIIEIVKCLDSNLIVNLSGGMRILICLVLIALAIVQPELIAKVELETEDLRKVIEIPPPILKLPSFKMSSAKFKIARIIVSRGVASISELAISIGKDKGLVSRHIKDLEEVNLVHTERKGKVKFVRPTSILKALIKG